MNKAIEHLEAHVPVDAPTDNPVELLHVATGLPKQRIKSAMTKGAVWMTRGSHSQRLRRAKRPLLEGDELHLYYDEHILAEVPPEPLLIADVGGYSVWRKPAGMRSQGSKWGDHTTVMRWAEQHLAPERPTFTVHRLDLHASGLILVAHTKTIAAALATLFRERDIEKHYRAVVTGDFSGQPNPLRIDQPIDAKAAISEVSQLKLSADGRQSLVEVRIETGRKHQIRRHLAALGHPVCGDRLYGTGEQDNVDLQLTACRLAFHCPVADAPVVYQLADEWLPDI